MKPWEDDSDAEYGYAFTRGEVLAARSTPLPPRHGRHPWGAVVPLRRKSPSTAGMAQPRRLLDVGAPPLVPPDLCCPAHHVGTVIPYPGGWVWRCPSRGTGCRWRDALAAETVAARVVLHPRRTG